MFVAKRKIYFKALVYLLLIIFLLAMWCYDNKQKIKRKKITTRDITNIPWSIPMVFTLVFVLVELTECEEAGIIPDEQDVLSANVSHGYETHSAIDEIDQVPARTDRIW